MVGLFLERHLGKAKNLFVIGVPGRVERTPNQAYTCLASQSRNGLILGHWLIVR